MGTNITSYVNKFENILDLIGSPTSYSGGNIGVGMFGPSIFNGVYNSIEQVKSTDPNAKANGIMGLINQAMGLLQKIGNLQATAQQRVQQDQKRAEELAEETKKTENELNGSMEKIGKDIEAQGKIVTDATGDMTKAQEELTAKKEEINKIIQEIQKKQQALTEAYNEGDPDKQKALLDEIFALGQSIIGITASTEEIQESFEEACQSVTNAYTMIETAKGNAINVQNDGQKQIVKSVEQATEASTSTAKTQADGVKNIATGEALLTSSAVTTAIPVVGSVVSSSTTQQATNLISAGTTETTGSINNLKELGNGIGRIGNNKKLLETFNTAIGGALDSFDGLVGAWNDVVEPLITSIGTLSAEGSYALQAQELSGIVVTDHDTIDTYFTNKKPTEEEQTNETESQTTIANDESKKPEYELETPKFTFGI